MYPEWPKSPEDLIPLPECVGPKLRPFDFGGPQNIEFLEYLGEGLHAHVFKVRILGEIYALKLFRFPYDSGWLTPLTTPDEATERESMRLFYNYSDPFSCECRAFGRLQEAGHEELATKCRGYVLLDEQSEDNMMTQFSDLDSTFNGDPDFPGCEDNRGRFPCKDGRSPPIRGTLKDFGYEVEDDLHDPLVRKILHDVIKIQQLGIINVDVGTRQIIDDKLCDFSTTLTTPHFLINPELNPQLTPKMIALMEYETFRLSLGDYKSFDEVIFDWNLEYKDQRCQISVSAFPDGFFHKIRYNLRSKPAREGFYSWVDPRKYDWRVKSYPVNPKCISTTKRSSDCKVKCNERIKAGSVKSRRTRRLKANLPRYYYQCIANEAADLECCQSPCISTEWYYKDGLIFPYGFRWSSWKKLGFS